MDSEFSSNMQHCSDLSYNFEQIHIKVEPDCTEEICGEFIDIDQVLTMDDDAKQSYIKHLYVSALKQCAKFYCYAIKYAIIQKKPNLGLNIIQPSLKLFTLKQIVIDHALGITFGASGVTSIMLPDTISKTKLQQQFSKAKNEFRILKNNVMVLHRFSCDETKSEFPEYVNEQIYHMKTLEEEVADLSFGCNKEEDRIVGDRVDGKSFVSMVIKKAFSETNNSETNMFTQKEYFFPSTP